LAVVGGNGNFRCSAGGRQQADEHVDGGGRSLRMSELPITDIDAVIVEITEDAEDIELVNADEYRLANNELIRNDESRWLRGRMNYRVTYDGGYSVATLPAGLKLAAMQAIRRGYDNQGGKSNQSAAGFGTAWQSLIESDILRQLEPFRIGGF